MNYQVYIGSTGLSLGAAVAPATVGAEYALISALMKDMTAAGFPKAVQVYCVAQILFESAWSTSNVSRTDNNWSGIKWLNKPYQKATRGLPAGDGTYYAHFANFYDWLNDYKRILSIKGSAGRPIDATSAAQFGNALRANKYFQDPNYSVKYNTHLKRVANALEWAGKQNKQFLEQFNKGQTTYTYDPQKSGLTDNAPFNADRKLNKITQWAEDHPWVALGGLVAGIVVVKKIL